MTSQKPGVGDSRQYFVRREGNRGRAGRVQSEAAAVVRRILSRRLDGFSRRSKLNGPGSGRRRWRRRAAGNTAETIKRLSGAMLCRGVSDPYYGNGVRDGEARLIGAKSRLCSSLRRPRVARELVGAHIALCATSSRFNSGLRDERGEASVGPTHAVVHSSVCKKW